MPIQQLRHCGPCRLELIIRLDDGFRQKVSVCFADGLLKTCQSLECTHLVQRPRDRRNMSMPEIHKVSACEVSATEIVEPRRVVDLLWARGAMNDERDTGLDEQVELWIDASPIEDNEAVDTAAPYKPINPILARSIMRCDQKIISMLLQNDTDLGNELAEDGIRDTPPRRADDECDYLGPLSTKIPRTGMHLVIELARNSVDTLAQFRANKRAIIQGARDRGGGDVRFSRDIRDYWLSAFQKCMTLASDFSPSCRTSG